MYSFPNLESICCYTSGSNCCFLTCIQISLQLSNIQYSIIIFFFIILFMYSFIFGCAGSLLLCGLFSSCSKQGLVSSCGLQTSHCSGFSCCGAQALGRTNFSSCGTGAQELWPTALDALWHVGSSQIRDQTHDSCIGRRILYH